MLRPGAGLQDGRAHPRGSTTQLPLSTGPGTPTSREQEGAPLIPLLQKLVGPHLPSRALQVTGDQAVYENELLAAQDVRTWSRGSITRDSTFR